MTTGTATLPAPSIWTPTAPRRWPRRRRRRCWRYRHRGPRSRPLGQAPPSAKKLPALTMPALSRHDDFACRPNSVSGRPRPAGGTTWAPPARSRGTPRPGPGPRRRSASGSRSERMALRRAAACRNQRDAEHHHRVALGLGTRRCSARRCRSRRRPPRRAGMAGEERWSDEDVRIGVRLGEAAER